MREITLNGIWDFFYNPQEFEAEKTALPRIKDYSIGSCDLSGSMGILNRMDDPELNKVLDEICAKTKAAGKILGTAAGGFPRWKERGENWFAGTSDWGAMAAGFRNFIKECR